MHVCGERQDLKKKKKEALLLLRHMCQKLNLELEKLCPSFNPLTSRVLTQQMITDVTQLDRREPDFFWPTQLCHSGDHFEAKTEKQRKVLERVPCPGNSTPSHLTHSEMGQTVPNVDAKVVY